VGKEIPAEHQGYHHNDATGNTTDDTENNGGHHLVSGRYKKSDGYECKNCDITE
jgi:hypothetical protein